MTEQEWDACPDWGQLWQFVGDREMLQYRKRRLFAVEVVRRIRHWLADPRSAAMIDAAEAAADASGWTDEFADATRAAFAAGADAGAPMTVTVAGLAASAAMWLGGDDTKTLRAVEFAVEAAGWHALVAGGTVPAAMPTPEALRYWNHARFVSGSSAESAAAAAALFREVFRYSARAEPFDATWRTATVVALAEGMYAAREFPAMPILADALQDAGCDDSELLAHCRFGGRHVRGCWALDTVLGRTASSGT